MISDSEVLREKYLIAPMADHVAVYRVTGVLADNRIAAIGVHVVGTGGASIVGQTLQFGRAEIREWHALRRKGEAIGLANSLATPAASAL